MIKNQFFRLLLIFLGLISIAVGIIGIFVPLLPTTPFLLLAAWLFCRSSDKLYHWINENKIFGKYLKNYRSGNGIPVTLKIFVLLLLNITILYAVILIASTLWLQIVLVLIDILVSIHILKIKNSK